MSGGVDSSSRVERYWQQFLSSLDPDQPKPSRFVEAFFFGTKPERAYEITPLVLDGTKTATGAPLWALEADGEKPAEPGDHWIVTNGGDDPACVIETTDQQVIPFDDVGEDYAWWGGEQDRTLESWRAMYWSYIVGECRRLGLDPDPRAPLVMERIRVVYADPPVDRHQPPRAGGGATAPRLAERAVSGAPAHGLEPVVDPGVIARCPPMIRWL